MLSHPSTNPKTKQVQIGLTELIKGTLDPIWKPITVSVNSLCGGDIENGAILVQCWDYDSQVIGSFTVSILLLISYHIDIDIDIIYNIVSIPISNHIESLGYSSQVVVYQGIPIDNL